MTSGSTYQHRTAATVKALRAELGMTTTALAEKVGVSQAQMWRLEDGQHGFRAWFKKAAFRVTPGIGVLGPSLCGGLMKGWA